MPYIKTTTNVSLTAAQQDTIKTRLGQDISLIGKSEGWLMVDFCADSPLYFKGTAAPAAIVTVELYGAADPAAYARMTAAITSLVGDTLSIPADCIFVKYAEYAHWGWNGSNF